MEPKVKLAARPRLNLKLTMVVVPCTAMVIYPFSNSKANNLLEKTAEHIAKNINKYWEITTSL